MPVEDRFIDKGLKRVELETFLQEELGRAGYGGIDIRRIPTGTRVAVYVERPGMVIGKKGRSINQLTEDLEKKFGLNNPQVEVVEIKKPEFYAPIMAKRVAFALERGIKFRRVGYRMLRRIMEAGARGVEIIISGKVSGERKKRVRFYKGYLSKTGEPAEKYTSSGYAHAKLKAGSIGVRVSIMPPDVPLPDSVQLPEETPAEPPGGEEAEAKVEGKVEEGEKPREAQQHEEGEKQEAQQPEAPPSETAEAASPKPEKEGGESGGDSQS